MQMEHDTDCFIHEWMHFWSIWKVLCQLCLRVCNQKILCNLKLVWGFSGQFLTHNCLQLPSACSRCCKAFLRTGAMFSSEVCKTRSLVGGGSIFVENSPSAGITVLFLVVFQLVIQYMSASVWLKLEPDYPPSWCCCIFPGFERWLRDLAVQQVFILDCVVQWQAVWGRSSQASTLCRTPLFELPARCSKQGWG